MKTLKRVSSKIDSKEPKNRQKRVLKTLSKLSLLVLLTSTRLLTADNSYENVPDKCPLKIKTPELKERQTAKIRLKNGLEAYLISDPNADKSAASLSVEAGSWSDPKAYPGMAHFLEHMLFLGTQKYPEEEGFMGFVREHNGLVNAYTASDRTVYMFSITNGHFDEALDRFAHFFIDPLFMTSGIERELHAVDEEHAKNLEHDGWREWMVFKEIGNPHHPNAKFSTGNAETLRPIPRQEIIRFYEKHYSANQMHLVLYSNQSMDKLKQIAYEDFSAIRNRNTKSLPTYDTLMSKEQAGKMIYIEPVRDLRSITLTWELPKSCALDKETGAVRLVAHALSSQHERGLLEYLKDKNLAEGLHVSVDRFSPEHLIFQIEVNLTKQGVQELDSVIYSVFSTINLYKMLGMPPYLFDEIQTMTTLNYQYQTRVNPFNVVSEHAAGMIYEPLETYPYKTLLDSAYNPNRIQDVLLLLQPDRCTYFVIAPESLTGIKPQKKEQWIGSEYAILPIANSQLLTWKNAKTPSDITLPRQNSFIPEHLELCTADVPEELTSTPSLLERDSAGIAYFWEDTRYRVPEISWKWSMKSPSLDGSCTSQVLAHLYTRSLYENMRPVINEAARSGLSMDVNYARRKINLEYSGYSDKAPLLLEKTLETIKHFHISEKQFILYKDALLSYYDSHIKSLPMSQGLESTCEILFSDAMTPRIMFNTLQEISYADFLAFNDQLFKKIYYEVMLSGNMQYTQAKDLYRHTVHTLAAAPYPLSEQKRCHVFVLDDKGGPYEVNEISPMRGNGAVLTIEEGEMSLRKKAAQMILSNGMSHDFFYHLRTKQQTAYIAKSHALDEENQLFQLFMVESSNHPPQELLYRFEQFLEAYVLDFNGAFSEDRFETIRSATIEELKQPPRNINGMNHFLYELAFTRNGNFNFINELITTLSFLTYDDVKNTAQEFFSRDNKRRIAVLVRGSQDKNAYRYLPVTMESLKETGRYITSSTD